MHADLKKFIDELANIIPPERMISDPLRTYAYGTDASFYRLTPKLVLRIGDVNELIAVLPIATRLQIAVTFRAAGTSLSGQAVSDSVLIQLDGNWKNIKIQKDGDLISLQPGVIGAQANRALMPFRRKIGPDPASINAAMIGGIAANNASGMCCGTAQNSYQTLHSMKIILADGAFLNTADSSSKEYFRRSHGDLLAGLSLLASEVRADEKLSGFIAHKYRIKNTTGYTLNALIDFDDPIEILQHLMIGSEGTLGFISEITYRTVPDPPEKACSLVIFPDVRTACRAVPSLKKSPATAVELIDPSSLRAIAGKRGMPDYIKSLPPKATALLVDTRADDPGQLQKHIEVISTLLADFQTLRPVDFTSDDEAYAQIWAVRKGLFPAVGAVRDIGTTVVIEDVAFPVEVLADAVGDLQDIFRQFDYHDAIIFGHAMDGNLHFVFSQAFDSQEQIDRYSGMLSSVADMVINRYGGSLKAEHGTGRNMAPFVEQEWGSQAYRLMWRIKSLIDPAGILNPDVILTKNQHLHLQNLKEVPPANESVDRCIECGFCEPVCPSLELTLSPRQRITVWREIQRLRNGGKRSDEQQKRLQKLEKTYQYQGAATCAACGLCEINCPVDINTGDLIRAYRSDRNARSRWIANAAAKHYKLATAAARGALTTAAGTHKLLGDRRMTSATRLLNRLSGGKIPQWSPAQPNAAAPEKSANSAVSQEKRAIYFPCCTARMMGPADRDHDQRALSDVVHALLDKAGWQAIIPDNVDQLCCGMPFKSKGYRQIAERKAEELATAIKDIGGNHPVFFDTSPCAQTMHELQPEVQILEPAQFAEQFLLDKLTITQKQDPVMLHVPCSAHRGGVANAIKQVAGKCSSNVIIPDDIFCCGFAGDKGFTTPELTASALSNLAAAVPEDCRSGYSSSRTCEVGLSQHSGVPYASIFYLLDAVSRKSD